MRMCYALQKSRIQPFLFSTATASKQRHLHTGYPTPPTALAGAGDALVQIQGQGLGLSLWRPPGASRSCHSTARGGAGRRGLSRCYRLWNALGPGTGGVTPHSPCPSKSFACGSSTAQPPALSGAAPPGAKTQGGKSFPGKSFPVTSLWQPSLLLRERRRGAGEAGTRPGSSCGENSLGEQGLNILLRGETGTQSSLFPRSGRCQLTDSPNQRWEKQDERQGTGQVLSGHGTSAVGQG